MVPWFYDLCIYPDSEHLWSQSLPSQLVNGCVYTEHPWELLTSAVHTAWLMLSQGSILFSLHLLCTPPHSTLHPFLFSKMSCFLIFSLWRWGGLSWLWRHGGSSHTTRAVFMGIFSKENHWEQFFHIFVCMFVMHLVMLFCVIYQSGRQWVLLSLLLRLDLN